MSNTIIADASKVSPAEFLRAMRPPPPDLSAIPDHELDDMLTKARAERDFAEAVLIISEKSGRIFGGRWGR